MYEYFEHTADIGLRIRAANLSDLLAEAGRALFSVIVSNLDEVRPVECEEFRIAAADPEDLLHDWLGELLVSCDARHRVFSRFEVQADDDGLTASAWGEPLDAERHALGMEVKAITYHQLKVKPDAGGWLAEVILDI